jgi:preprotein translocase subunit SecG
LKACCAGRWHCPRASGFYLRSFFLVLLLSGLSAAVSVSFDMKSGAHFMEYVWKEAEGISSILEKALWFLGLFLVLITVLIATLKIRNDE